MQIKLIVGLQNPGSQYANTRHNAGGWLVQQICKLFGGTWTNNKNLQADMAVADIDSFNCRLIIPTTYMNTSGLSVQKVAQFYKIKACEILVAHDELDLPTGSVRLKTGGGHGGHNGLRDIIQQLGSSNFHRVRLGIGHPGCRTKVHDYVLSAPNIDDKKLIENAISQFMTILPICISGRLDLAMNKLHTLQT